MGVDLRLLVACDDELGEYSSSEAMLDIGRYPKLYEAIEALPDTPLAPVKFSCHCLAIGDHGSGWGPLEDRDAYGSPYRWVRAGDLARCMEQYDGRVGGFDCRITRAAMRFVQDLPVHWPIVLFWH